MNFKMLTLLAACCLTAIPAMAQTMKEMGAHRMKIHGRMVMVHQMKMADGTIVFAMSQSDLQRLLSLRSKEFSDSFAH